MDPLSEQPRVLPPSPILMVATSDAKLRLFTFGSRVAATSVVTGQMPLPPPAPIVPSSGTRNSGPPSPLDARTEAAKAARLPSDDEDDLDETEDEGTEDDLDETEDEGMEALPPSLSISEVAQHLATYLVVTTWPIIVLRQASHPLVCKRMGGVLHVAPPRHPP